MRENAPKKFGKFTSSGGSKPFTPIRWAPDVCGERIQLGDLAISRHKTVLATHLDGQLPKKQGEELNLFSDKHAVGINFDAGAHC